MYIPDPTEILERQIEENIERYKEGHCTELVQEGGLRVTDTMEPHIRPISPVDLL